MVRISISMLLMIACYSSARAAYLRHADANSTLPFELILQRGNQATHEIVLQIANNTDSPISIAAWQLELELRPLNGPPGSMHFERVVAPPDSLFGPVPGPLTIPSSSKDRLLVFDGRSSAGPQAVIGQQLASNIVQFTISPTADASGSFQLVTRKFDAENPDLGSSWLEEGKSVPTAFQNLTPSEFPEFVLLGTINVRAVPEVLHLPATVAWLLLIAAFPKRDRQKHL